jgi:hypothetical protein
MFEAAGMSSLLNAGYLRTMRGCPFLAVFAPVGAVRQELIIPWAVTTPTTKLESFPW